MDARKYLSHTTVSDLLQDDFFIESILEPTEETEKFWIRILQVGHLPFEVYEDAKTKLLSEHRSDYLFDKDLLFSKIRTSSKKKNRLRFLYRYSAAAIVLITCGLSFFYFSNIFNEQFVATSSSVSRQMIDTGEIRLLSDGRDLVNINGDQAELDFSDPNKLIVNSKQISSIDSKAAVMNQIIVPHGKRISVVLADGSKLWINAGSTVKFPSKFTGVSREIYVNGEVYGDIAKNPNMPFVFRTKEFDVQVLGTSLDVHAYESDKKHRVTLVEGRVKVKRGKGEYYLSPNQSYSLNNNIDRVQDIDVKYFTSWKDGYYNFKDQKLENIIENLERYYGVTILCDDKVAALLGSGTLDLKDNIDQVLNGISFSMGLKMKKENKHYILLESPMK